jgi:hypothetical protein
LSGPFCSAAVRPLASQSPPCRKVETLTRGLAPLRKVALPWRARVRLATRVMHEHESRSGGIASVGLPCQGEPSPRYARSAPSRWPAEPQARTRRRRARRGESSVLCGSNLKCTRAWHLPPDRRQSSQCRVIQRAALADAFLLTVTGAPSRGARPAPREAHRWTGVNSIYGVSSACVALDSYAGAGPAPCAT